MRFLLTGGLLAGLLLPLALEAQRAPPRSQPDTAELVFAREVFAYPLFQRRDPFLPLLTGEGGGPRFEELTLRGIIFSPNPDLSVVLFGVRGEGEQETSRQTLRARRGDRLGNVHILEIQRTRVVVEVEEFGLTEQHIMELRRPGQGGPS